MGHAPNTDLEQPQATRFTMIICGFATLAVAAVLGLSLACGAADALGGDQPVTLVTRPAASDAVLADVTPFDMNPTMAAARR